MRAVIKSNLAILSQKIALLDLLVSKHGATKASDAFQKTCPIVGASIGQHYRHSMDHVELAALVASSAQDASMHRQQLGDLHYDLRVRGGTLEKDLVESRKRLSDVSDVFKSLNATIDDGNTEITTATPVTVYFNLAADDASEIGLPSTVERELVGLNEAELPEGFGRAPSTILFDKKQGEFKFKEKENIEHKWLKDQKERMRFTAIVESTESCKNEGDDTFQPSFSKMEGVIQRVEESKGDIDLGFERIEEDRKVDNIVLSRFKDSNDILYHPQPVSGFFACLAVLLRDAFYFMCSGSSYSKYSTNDDGDGKMSARIQREMMSCNESCNDTTHSVDHSKADQFWVRNGMDVYSRQDVCARKEGTRLQVPAPMIFTNEKLIGPPPALKSDGIGYQRTRRKSMAFTKPDGTPLIHCRYDEMPINDDTKDNETECDNSIKYVDLVKQSHNTGIFGWFNRTNSLPALDVDIKVKKHEEQTNEKKRQERELQLERLSTFAL
eukprot:scaffold11863_cov165-Skeletonema_marinoi.AAC.5